MKIDSSCHLRLVLNRCFLLIVGISKKRKDVVCFLRNNEKLARREACL